MMSVLWSKSNRVRPYGKSGLETLSYKPDEDEDLYVNGVSFDSFEKNQLVNNLYQEIPHIIEDQNSISFKKFTSLICNQTNADKDALELVLKKLHKDKEIIIEGRNGGRKRSTGLNIFDNDIIRIRPQKWFSAMKDV